MRKIILREKEKVIKMNKKKLVAAVLFLVALLTVGAYAYSGGSGTSADPYQISNAADLASLSTSAASSTLNGIYFKQTADITLSSAFTPIGSASYPFAGTYDGASYKISGLNVSGGEYAALFGCTNSASIKNVRVVSSVSSGTKYVSLVVAKADGNTTISNCSSDGTISLGSGSAINAYIGGIAGYASAGTVIEDSNSSATIASIAPSFNAFIGGIVGQNIGTVKRSTSFAEISGSSSNYLLEIGGIVGENRGSIEGSVNEGAVSGQILSNAAALYIGGVAGCNNGGSIVRVQNTASVGATGYSTYPAYAGGIVGYNNVGTISVAKNSGDITSTGSYAGGIVGVNHASEADSSITDANNAGTVTGSGSIAGGIAGGNTSAGPISHEAAITSSLNSTSGSISVGAVETTEGGISSISNVYVNGATDSNANTVSNLSTVSSLSGLTNAAWVYPKDGFNPSITVVKDLTATEVVGIDKDASANKVAYTIYNPTGSAKNASVVISFFNEGRLVGTKIVENISIRSGYNVYTASSEYVDDSDRVKIVAFSTLSGLVPVADFANY